MSETTYRTIRHTTVERTDNEPNRSKRKRGRPRKHVLTLADSIEIFWETDRHALVEASIPLLLLPVLKDLLSNYPVN